MVNIPIHKIPSVLLIEDEEEHIDLYKGYLEHAGFRVFAEREGRGGIERAKRERPGVIILDLRLPGLHGTDVLKILKETPETKDYPVVFITARAQQRETAELQALGAAGVISKPFSPKDLPEQLRAIWSALPAQEGVRGNLGLPVI